MIGVDTNVLVRLVVADGEQQHAVAKSFFADRSPDDPAFVSAIVLAEMIWLLRRRFGYSRRAVEDVVRSILSSDDFVVEHGENLLEILQSPDSPLTEIADHLIAWSAEASGCARTVTFDRRAARAVPAMELLS